MTITTNPSRDEYTSTAGQTVFNYTFKIYANTDLNVYVTPSGQSPDDSADLTTDYVVDTGTIGDEAGGFITFNTPLNNGDAVTIVSAIPYDRTVDYQNNGDFLPETVNDDNDRQVSQIKQILEQTGRTLQFQESLQGASTLSLPDPVSQNFMRWKTDLTGLENVELVDGALVVADGQLLIFPTVAALKASTSALLVPGVNVQTQGYYTAGDGGGARYLIIPGDTSDNFGRLLLSNGNTAVIQIEGIVGVKQFGAVADGVTDDLAVLRYALDTYKNVEPENGVYALSDTLQIFTHQRLFGRSGNVRPNSQPDEALGFKWIGPVNNRKTVILVGVNDVGVDPVSASSGCQVGNFYIDGDYKTGFGLYGTYVQNECLYSRITTTHTTEYGAYIAKCFYGKIEGLYSFEHENNGIALGMPLEYRDDSQPAWAEVIELNRMDISDLRSQNSGQRFMTGGADAGTWNPTNPALRRRGYGIGIGIGNGMIVEHFTSEASGGVNLYSYTGSQPVKTIKSGYLEAPAIDSGLDPATDKPQMILENTSTQGEEYTIKDIHMSFASGGIYTVGENRPIILDNLHQPRFLKTLDDPVSNDPSKFVSLRNVHPGLGLVSKVDSVPNNYDPDINVDSTSWATAVTPKQGGGAMNVWIRTKAGFVEKGTIGYRRLDGTTSEFAWTAYDFVPIQDQFVLLLTTNTPEVDRIQGTGLASGAQLVDILVEYCKPSFQADINA